MTVQKKLWRIRLEQAICQAWLAKYEGPPHPDPLPQGRGEKKAKKAANLSWQNGERPPGHWLPCRAETHEPCLECPPVKFFKCVLRE
jgi:hypothetical protein